MKACLGISSNKKNKNSPCANTNHNANTNTYHSTSNICNNASVNRIEEVGRILDTSKPCANIINKDKLINVSSIPTSININKNSRNNINGKNNKVMMVLSPKQLVIDSSTLDQLQSGRSNNACLHTLSAYAHDQNNHNLSDAGIVETFRKTNDCRNTNNHSKSVDDCNK